MSPRTFATATNGLSTAKGTNNVSGLHVIEAHRLIARVVALVAICTLHKILGFINRGIIQLAGCDDTRSFAGVGTIPVVDDNAVDAAVYVGEIGKAGRSAASSAALAAFDRAADDVTGLVGAVDSS